MLCDAHVHIGYYSRKGREKPFYYSPRRVVGVVNRCGVDEFIVSSTCAQVEGIGIADIVREAREVKRLAGQRAHIFFWLSGHLYDEDPEMCWLNLGLYDGIKFHEGETSWMQRRQKDLRRIASDVSFRSERMEPSIEVGEACPRVPVNPFQLRALPSYGRNGESDCRLPECLDGYGVYGIQRVSEVA